MKRLELKPAAMRPRDLLRVGGVGLRTRPLRVVLSALGIAIGIAAMISVVGISTSSRANLERTLESLGTNMLTAGPGQSLLGEDSKLPKSAVSSVRRVTGVESATAIGRVAETHVYRNNRVPKSETGSLTVSATSLDLPETVGIEIAQGTWLTEAWLDFPTVVLGFTAAQRLGVGPLGQGRQVLIGERLFTVVGIMHPVPLAPELNNAALVGWSAAERYLAFDGHPTTIYTRTADTAVGEVRSVLATTVNPEHPEEVRVSRPSDALAAQEATDKAFTGLLLGLGAVALLVGGVGVANTMVISVLERRAEIGLRRALGATRAQICWQFVVESQLLAALGGLGGVVIGGAVTAVYATTQGWPAVIPMWAVLGGAGATLVIGAIAGLYPAVRAARLSPTEALAAP